MEKVLPRVPLLEPKKASVRPVAPPTLLGQKPKNAPSAPLSANDDKLDNSDPSSTLALIGISFKGFVAGVPKMIKTNGIGLLILLAIWIPLWVFPTFRLSKIGFLLVFLTATYNNFVAKSVFAVILFKVVIPFFKRAMKTGVKKEYDDIMLVKNKIIQGFAFVSDKAMSIFIPFVGIGFIASNYLTRNNKIDKYLVVFLAACSLLGALKSNKSMNYIISRVISKDIYKALKKPYDLTDNHILIGISGIACAYVLGIVLSFLANILGDTIGSNIGYILGVIVIIFGVFYPNYAKKSTKSQ